MRSIRHGKAFFLAIALGALAYPTLAQDAGLSIRESTYRREKASAPAFVIENRYYRALLVPDMGGRVVEWYDKQAERNVVHDQGYGGLLDDHGARHLQPYRAEWLRRDATEAVIALEIEEDAGLRYRKTVHFHAQRPALRVDYRIVNASQESARLLFRNVVRPGGTEFGEDELYCYSRVTGLQRDKAMPTTDDPADPWSALVHRRDKVVVATAFTGDVLARLYTWRGSKVAPTYEFMFPQLEAGRQIDATYYWLLCHGLEAVDYAHRAFVLQLEGELDGGQLACTLALTGTWEPLPDLTVRAEILNPERTRVAEIPAVPLPLPVLDEVRRHTFDIALAAQPDYAILLLHFDARGLRDEIVIEKAFPQKADAARLKDYRRPVRWVGAPVEQRPVPGWVKAEKYVIQPQDADRRRGYMVFEETGERRGQHTERLALDLGQGEQESFPLHFHSLGLAGKVEVHVDAPAGLRFETFVPETVPEKLWGRVHHGLKLLPGAEFNAVDGEDRTLFFRLTAAEATPGGYPVRLRFEPAAGQPLTVTVQATVRPVRFPEHPYMVFDVNNCVNYLCSKQETKWKRAWDDTLARNYLDDMHAHGVRSQTLVGTNAPNSHYSYHLVKDRETGLPLPDAIKQTPSRFRSIDMPHLDFSYWDWLTDRILEYGNTQVKWPMGGCGRGFMQQHSQLTALIYGHPLPDGDLRQMLVQEWYYSELVRYLKDRGITRVLCTIDDEIPSEKLPWWCQHAYRCLQMGLAPGVTQSAHTIASDTLINLVAPFMKYWIIGTLHKESIDLRRSQDIIRPDHWTTTYHSSANHWRGYDEMRRHCGIRNAFFDLDACWIQVYWRWRQSEAVIYPGVEGPISSAAWEGARDGLDDANLYLLVKAMLRALPAAEARVAYSERLESLVGLGEDALIRFADRMSSVGMVTDVAAPYPDTARFRRFKQRLLELVAELTPLVPAQPANVRLGPHALIAAGKPCFAVPAGMAAASEAALFLRRAAGTLECAQIRPENVDPETPYPVFFCGTWAELRALLPKLAEHPQLADLGAEYPAPGGYALRFVQRPAPPKEASVDQPQSMVLVCADAAGMDKALNLLGRVLTTPKEQYSHWLPAHDAR